MSCAIRRSLRGNVDRNDSVAAVMTWSGVVPYVGTWIEISCLIEQRQKEQRQVVPYVGTWIEINRRRQQMTATRRRSLRGNVDRNSMYRGTWRKWDLSFPTWERG